MPRIYIHGHKKIFTILFFSCKIADTVIWWQKTQRCYRYLGNHSNTNIVKVQLRFQYPEWSVHSTLLSGVLWYSVCGKSEKGPFFLCFFLWNVLLFKQYNLYVTAIPSQAFTPMHEVSFLLVIQKVFLFFVHHMSSTMGCFIVFVYSSHDPPEQWDSSHWAWEGEILGTSPVHNFD